MKTKLKEEYPVICTTCGSVSDVYVKIDGEGAPDRKAPCPKCSKTAYVMTLGNFWSVIYALNKENIRLKNELFEIQCWIERQEEAGVTTT